MVRIADGDTIELIPVGQTRPIRIRFEGVDAPEVGEVFSRESQALMSTLLLNQRVGVDGHDVDRYGRLVARVTAGGKDASSSYQGRAPCQRFATDAGLAAAEAQARAPVSASGRRQRPSRSAWRSPRVDGVARRHRVPA